MLQSPDLTVSADLSVIAGDIEGDPLWQRDQATGHRLVLRRRSRPAWSIPAPCSAACAAPRGGARYLRDAGGEVNHFRYFTNEKTVKWLGHGLTRPRRATTAASSPIATAPHEAPALARGRAPQPRRGAPRPLAVVLPGTMGRCCSSAAKLSGSTTGARCAASSPPAHGPV
ncbi:MAG: hypothetical protein R3E34_13365 [Rhodocyclaceae bacterium]